MTASWQFLFGEIKAGKVAGVGVIFQPDIDGIGAVFDGRLKRPEGYRLGRAAP